MTFMHRIEQYEPQLGVAVAEDLSQYIRNGGWCTEHVYTLDFEREIAKYLDVKYCACVSNGTIAITIALLACGVKPGDGVIVPDLTMVATATAAQLIGAGVHFIDVEKNTLCLDPNRAMEAISKLNPRPKALIYVSLHGRWDNTGAVLELFEFCRKLKIAVIEDAAQSFGSRSPYGAIGTQADISTFSFSPQKSITTGQGGAVVTNDKAMSKRIRRLKNFGRDSGGVDIHPKFGINAKFSDLQAIVGLDQLERIDEIVKRKKWIYETYQTELKDVSEILWVPTNLSLTSPWFVDIYTDLRDPLKKHLKKRNIHTRALYPTLTQQPCFGRKNNSQTIANYFSRRGLWLPSSMSLIKEEIITVCDEIKEYFREFRSSTTS